MKLREGSRTWPGSRTVSRWCTTCWSAQTATGWASMTFSPSGPRAASRRQRNCLFSLVDTWLPGGSHLALAAVSCLIWNSHNTQLCLSVWFRQDFTWNVINGRGRCDGPGFDVRAWVFDWRSPASLQGVTEQGGPDALFMQFWSEFFVQVSARAVPPPSTLGDTGLTGAGACHLKTKALHAWLLQHQC